jgi:hypothetical protein
MRWAVLLSILLLSAVFNVGCTLQTSLGPAAWSTVPPVIPGFTPVPLPGGGFIEEPTPPATPPATPEQTTLGALQEAQATREAIRKLAR